VAAVAEKSQVVLATGGGVVLRQQNIDRLKATGTLVCLSASENEIVARTQGDRLRPLLNRPDRLQVIRDLLALRKPQYRQADFWFDTDGKTEAAVAAAILDILREEGHRDGDDPGESGQSKL